MMAGEDHVLTSGATPSPTSARREANGSRQAPASPIGGASLLVAQARACDVHGEDFACVRDEQLPSPLGQGRPPARDGMLGLERAEQRAVLGVREANEQPMLARMRGPRSTHSRHETFRYHKEDGFATVACAPRIHSAEVLATSPSPSYQSPPRPPSSDPRHDYDYDLFDLSTESDQAHLASGLITVACWRGGSRPERCSHSRRSDVEASPQVAQEANRIQVA